MLVNGPHKLRIAINMMNGGVMVILEHIAMAFVLKAHVLVNGPHNQRIAMLMTFTARPAIPARTVPALVAPAIVSTL